MCTLLLKDTIQYYVDRQSSVYTCFVDATKAFDMGKFDKLFLLMIKRGVSSIDLRAMMDLYSHQRIRTVWSGTYTGSFSATNGMRQGSVALPILFGLYMDELIQRLESNGDGCWLGPHFYGAMGYADDLSLLCPTAKGLQRMLKVCEIFGEEFGMQFNPKKSVCVHFSRTPNITPRMTLAGKELSWVKRVKHLGNYLCQDLSSQYEIQMKRSDLVGRVNTVIANLGNAPGNVLSTVFNTQCCHFYGAQAWDLTSTHVKAFGIMWHNVEWLCEKTPQIAISYSHQVSATPGWKGSCFGSDWQAISQAL